jgi:aspartyl-tRNA(Asn)/glutamyl-tRNA(Gln) amidotransferase subunit A
VEDLMLAMQVIGQPHAKDPASLYGRQACAPTDVDGSSGTAAVSGSKRPLRVGYCVQMGGHAYLEPCIADAMAVLVRDLPKDLLKSHELHLVAVDLSDVHTAEAAWTTWCSRVVEIGVDCTDEQRASWGPDLTRQYQRGLAQTSLEVVLARKQLRESSMRLHALFSEIDLLLTPSTVGGAPPAGDFVADNHPLAAQLRSSGNWLAATPFSHPMNVTQQPAVSLPWGTNDEGLPFGLQVVGARYDDARVLRMGAALQTWLAKDI